MNYCTELKPVLKILHSVVTLIQFGVPFLLILFGMIDLGKAVMASKEDEMKKAQSTLIKRIIYAIAIFLVVTIVTLVMKMVGNADIENGAESWASCWSKIS